MRIAFLKDWHTPLATIALGIALLGTHSLRVDAQLLASAEVIVRVTVPPYFEIVLENENVHFTEDDILGGVISDDTITVQRDEAIQLRTKANVPFALLISAASDLLSGPNGNIPMNRLQWHAGGDWTPLSTEPQLMREFYTPGSEQIAIALRLVLEITDPTGVYEGAVFFTLQESAV